MYILASIVRRVNCNVEPNTTHLQFTQEQIQVNIDPSTSYFAVIYRKKSTQVASLNSRRVVVKV
ncbi:uncharacterized protein BO72DRAFT_445557 [Aspergillus fijiensis CBS 313.89]|uniref:Uncharacterized protein n=1 Tax=Aspergillus fijiensis CBS 313.89 TaxID=1448319 RepID=A0A8G1W0R0_9EURO|nr:uncharacterized protein BO72DRAFT_445557 [Aspergillus fijiensis CBS 313.89]RAK80160.1 hypothetical protein BO72DRAFT_445557 [Aspergillus fijiensis CBS 313.89]